MRNDRQNEGSSRRSERFSCGSSFEELSRVDRASGRRGRDGVSRVATYHANLEALVSPAVEPGCDVVLH